MAINSERFDAIARARRTLMATRLTFEKALALHRTAEKEFFCLLEGENDTYWDLCEAARIDGKLDDLLQETNDGK